MKNIFTALILGLAVAGVSFAQAPARDKGVKTLVVEFTAGPNASAMNDMARRQLQTTLSASLNHTRKFDVYDTRHTRNATQSNLTVINASDSARNAAAVRAGKQLGVAYVVTGTVSEYIPKGTDGYGSAAVTVRMIEVATGKVKYTGEVTVRSGKPMKTGSVPEMHAEVMKHIVDQFTELIESRF